MEAMVLTPPCCNEAQALFGIGDVVFDPTNFAKNTITATQMIRQVEQMILQVQNSDHEVEMMLLNLAPALGQCYYPLDTWERLLLAELEKAGQRSYSSRTIDYYHGDLQPTYLDMYPGFRLGDHYPLRYAINADTALNTFSAVMGRAHIEAGEEADARYRGTRDGIAERSDAAEGNLQALQTNNAAILSVADGVHRLEKSEAEMATLIATRNAHDIQKEAWGEAIFHYSLVQAGADKDTGPKYASGAPGGVKYFDEIGGGQFQ
jgi:P-type conjugative transfer protein TrbJ